MANTIKRETIHANGIDISVYSEDLQNDYICLTDIAKKREGEYFTKGTENTTPSKKVTTTNKIKNIWLAHYTNETNYNGKYIIWQMSNTGKVNGINGAVDMNYAYVDYPKLIKSAGRNGFTKPTNSSSNTTTKTKEKKSNTEIAKEVLVGKWGNGEIRKTALTNAGYNYDKIQEEVNKLLSRKTIETIAKEVIAGEWGNGEARKKALTKAGYDYEAVQKKVNELL